MQNSAVLLFLPAPAALALLLGLAPAAMAAFAPPPLRPGRDLYLGVDLSTQSATGILLDAELRAVSAAVSVNFDAAFPEYGTEAGMNVGAGGVVTSPVRMWLRALDELFASLKATGLLGRCACVSFSGQQHGSVYWTQEGLDALAAPPRAATGFADALGDAAFALQDCPIWADSSTQAECDAIEEALDGAAAVAALAGSRAYARFTGPQAAAVAARAPAAYAATARLSLVSSFGAALLVGAHVPVDTADASGTLLMDLEARAWSPPLLDAMPAGLEAKLGAQPVPAHTLVGVVAPFASRCWGLPDGCAVAASSGDNPCAIAGLGLALPGDLALSLGTSDTLLGVAPAAAATPATEGHLMAHPTDPHSVMAMLCYQNGGAARQALCDERCGAQWSKFDEALRAAPAGNGGLLGLNLPLPEITPVIARSGSWHVNADGGAVSAAGLTDAQAVRAVVEGRFLSMRARGGAIGLRGARRVLATGGGSNSKEMLQTAADVFGADVLLANTPDAAAVGAARRAAHAHALAAGDAAGDVGRLPYADFLDAAGAGAGDGLAVAARARPAASKVYNERLVARYRAFEDRVADGAL